MSDISDIGIAVVGCGYWGKNLVRNFAELGALRAVVDADPATANEMGTRFQVPVMSLDEAIASDAIDAIATASPAAVHHDIAVRAMESGKSVFVEKPIALSLSDGEAMQAAAARTGKILMVGHLLQYHPAYRKLRDLVEEGAIGRLKYVYSNRLSMGKLRTEEDVVWSFAPHDISMILGLVEGEAPSDVAAHSAGIVSDGLADSAHLHLTFASGLKAHVFTSWLHPMKEHRFVAIGETGCLVFDDTKPWAEKLVSTGYRVADGPALEKGAVTAIPVEEAEPLKEECAHFLHAVAAGIAPRTDAHEALAVLRVLKQADKALGKEVEA
ncbi:Gfo/Idh/MocA family oxidoreductase [Aliihoeflea aestuarii]|jgi:UDP-2-acetamido-3-amino-2,3-dideoxy-glucuronate N-acetyltransferase|uniref:Gfo/Idh/MocA family protein n=1 Tax=Aliihoeflea aestuarii TaxID=453840 RepID=UPI00209298DE|nr:Gfo/Idh/MocA family oxidoreductase [Aliihoeflea aestuarii]MCO6390168.1 Gfo/Idh/MocA family oxidoreductase [Aliihoeflea aestuarii]